MTGSTNRGAAGFSYTEVLVAMFLIAIVLVPAIDALHGGVQAGDIHLDQAKKYTRLVGKMEHILAKSFDELAQEADAVGGSTTPVLGYSDDPGTKRRRLVYLARYDGDNADADNDPFTGADDGILWVRVAIEDSPLFLESLTSQ